MQTDTSGNKKTTIELHVDTITQILRALDTRIEFCITQQEDCAERPGMEDVVARWRVRELEAHGAAVDFKKALGVAA